MLSNVVRFCLDPLRLPSPAGSADCETDAFETRFEIYFALFLSSRVDGRAGACEERFIVEAVRQLGWSATDRNLLTSRVDHLPAYSLDEFKRASACAPLGKAIGRLAFGAAVVDGPLNADERRFIDNLYDRLAGAEPDARTESQILSMLQSPASSEAPIEPRHPESLRPGAPPRPSPPADLKSVLAELDALVGLEGVKTEVKRLTSFLEIQKQRSAASLQVAKVSLHMVFSGAPGTGKTSVARIVARIFHSLGLLREGHLIETDRSGLVGQYVGHTAKKTNEVINRALGGVLFIDEAYGLSRSEGENDFGSEAIDTLVKRMEDDRHQLAVIVAGYPAEMQYFLASNPGMQSRFSTHLTFENYCADDLCKIFSIFCENNDYRLSESAKEKLFKVFERHIQNADSTFGNARFARNLFEQIIRNHAFRLTRRAGPLDRDILATITSEDIAA